MKSTLQFTLAASGLYRLLSRPLVGGSSTAKADTLARRFVQAAASVEIFPERIQARIGRNAYAAVLIQAGFADTAVRIPWLDDRPSQISSGQSPDAPRAKAIECCWESRSGIAGLSRVRTRSPEKLLQITISIYDMQQ